jgi:hypothetical protein
MVTQNRRTGGWTSAATVGLAFTAGALALLTVQQRRQHELRLRVEQHRVNLHLLSKAIDDPELAAVLSTVDLGGEPVEDHPRLRRQYLFSNALYTSILSAYFTGTVTWQELHGQLRVLCQSDPFRGYWEATRHHRESLAPSSAEARVGRMMDGLVRDLNEADTEEWWVVGEPPTT